MKITRSSFHTASCVVFFLVVSLAIYGCTGGGGGGAQTPRVDSSGHIKLNLSFSAAPERSITSSVPASATGLVSVAVISKKRERPRLPPSKNSRRAT